MARGVNKVILVGNVGGDPEVRDMPNGNKVTNLTLATSETWTDKQTNQKVEKTEWHRVVFFGKVAEIVGEYVKKGSQIYLEGRLQTREWEKDGVKRYTTEIVVDMNGTMQLLGGKPGEGGEQQQRAPRPPQSTTGKQSTAPQGSGEPTPTPEPAPDFDSFDDDIPF